MKNTKELSMTSFFIFHLSWKCQQLLMCWLKEQHRTKYLTCQQHVGQAHKNKIKEKCTSECSFLSFMHELCSSCGEVLKNALKNKNCQLFFRLYILNMKKSHAAQSHSCDIYWTFCGRQWNWPEFTNISDVLLTWHQDFQISLITVLMSFIRIDLKIIVRLKDGSLVPGFRVYICSLAILTPLG